MISGRLWLAILWAAIILALCSVPGKELPSAGWMQLVSLDKWVHFGIFMILMILVLRAVRSQYAPISLKFDARWWWLAAIVIYGGLTEIYQHLFFADRFADIYDFVANTAGAVAGWWIYERYFLAHNRNNIYQKTF